MNQSMNKNKIFQIAKTIVKNNGSRYTFKKKKYREYTYWFNFKDINASRDFVYLLAMAEIPVSCNIHGDIWV
jgi:hypothetical protein